jgi:hypothetical protein
VCDSPKANRRALPLGGVHERRLCRERNGVYPGGGAFEAKNENGHQRFKAPVPA